MLEFLLKPETLRILFIISLGIATVALLWLKLTED